MIEYGLGKPFPADYSLDECALVCLERSESEFNEMMQSFGIAEIQYVSENGCAMIYEAEGFKGVIEKIGAWLKARFEDIRQMFDKAIKFISNKVKEAKAKIENAIEKAKTKGIKGIRSFAEHIKPDAKLGKIYKYEGLEDEVNSMKYLKMIEKWDYDLHSGKDIDSVKASVKAELGDDKNVVKGFTDKFRGQEEALTKDYILKNIERLNKNSSDFNKAKGDLKKEYNKIKTMFDKSITDLKKTIKESDLDKGVFKGTMEKYRYSASLLTQYSGAFTKACCGRIIRDIQLVIKTIVAAKGKKEAAPKNESYTIQTEIASLFNF